MITCDCPVCTSEDRKDKRLRSSVLVESATTSIVIDTGPDFRYQMLREKVSKLDAVIFTHEHKDHIAGLDDVRAFNFKQQADMPVYCTEAVERALWKEYDYIFQPEKYPGVPRVAIHRIHEQPFRIGDIDIIPIRVFHYKMPVLGFRIGDFTYITDANHIPESEMDKIKGSRVFVLNALRIEPHISHFNLEQALEIMEDVKPETGYLTHISHLLGKHADIEPTLPAYCKLAFDGLRITEK